jgi:hypothetical protein
VQLRYSTNKPYTSRKLLGNVESAFSLEYMSVANTNGLVVILLQHTRMNLWLVGLGASICFTLLRVETIRRYMHLRDIVIHVYCMYPRGMRKPVVTT